MKKITLISATIVLLMLNGCTNKENNLEKKNAPLKLCKHYNCDKGWTGWFEWNPESDVSWVGDEFNDSISQIEVRYGTWRFFQHTNYNTRPHEVNGWYKDFKPGIYKLKDYGINDEISSFKRME